MKKDVLKNVLKEKGMIQKDLCEELDLSPKEVSLVVNKEKQVSKLLSEKIAGILGVNVEDIFSSDDILIDNDKAPNENNHSPDGGEMVMAKSLSVNPLYIGESIFDSLESKLVTKKVSNSDKFKRAVILRLIELEGV